MIGGVLRLPPMAKPFKLDRQREGTSLQKLPDNRDTDVLTDRLVKMAKSENKRVSDVVKENPVPDHEDEIEWPKADAGRAPMKLK